MAKDEELLENNEAEEELEPDTTQNNSMRGADMEDIASFSYDLSEDIAEEDDAISRQDINGINDTEAASLGEMAILKKQVENLQTILKEKDEEILRRTADLDNYRKRLEREKEDALKYANQSIVKDFLPVLDNFERTLPHAEKDSPLFQGVALTLKMFLEALEKHGIKKIVATQGTAFDPNVHEAIALDKNPDFQNNAITMCVENGYVLNGRVVRTSKVKVNRL